MALPTGYATSCKQASGNFRYGKNQRWCIIIDLSSNRHLKNYLWDNEFWREIEEMRKFVAPGQILSLYICYALYEEQEVIYLVYFCKSI